MVLLNPDKDAPTVFCLLLELKQSCLCLARIGQGIEIMLLKLAFYEDDGSCIERQYGDYYYQGYVILQHVDNYLHRKLANDKKKTI